MNFFAFTQVGDSSPARHLVFAGFYYLIGAAFIIGRTVRGELRWKRGRTMSFPALIIFILSFFTWGSLSLASGLGYGLSAGYDMGIRTGTLVLCLVYSFYDKGAA